MGSTRRMCRVESSRAKWNLSHSLLVEAKYLVRLLVLRRFQGRVTMMSLSLTMAQTIESLESLNRSVQSTRMTFAGLMEAARAVKIGLHQQNIREQNKFDDVFTTAETREIELELDTLSLA